MTAITPIDATPDAVFAVLADPASHAAIDGTGWVREPLDPAPLTHEGQMFRMAMYHENHPDKNYEMANRVEIADAPRTIAWQPGQASPDTGDIGFGGWTLRLVGRVSRSPTVHPLPTIPASSPRQLTGASREAGLTRPLHAHRGQPHQYPIASLGTRSGRSQRGTECAAQNCASCSCEGRRTGNERLRAAPRGLVCRDRLNPRLTFADSVCQMGARNRGCA